MSNLRNKIIRLAHQKPELRKDLLPLLKEGTFDEIWRKEPVPNIDIKVFTKDILHFANRFDLMKEKDQNGLVVFHPPTIQNKYPEKLYFILDSKLPFIEVYEGDDYKPYQMGREGIPMILKDFAKNGYVSLKRAVLAKTIPQGEIKVPYKG